MFFHIDLFIFQTLHLGENDTQIHNFHDCTDYLYVYPCIGRLLPKLPVQLQIRHSFIADGILLPNCE